MIQKIKNMQQYFSDDTNQYIDYSDIVHQIKVNKSHTGTERAMLQI